MAGRRSAVVFVVALLISLPVVADGPPNILETTDVTDETRLVLPIDWGSRIEIKGVFGEVDVSLADGDETVVEIARQTPGGEPRLVLVRHDQGYTLCAVHTSPNPKKPNECVPGRKGRMRQGIKKDWPRVNFSIAVPELVGVRAVLFGDRMEARAGVSDLDLEMDTGDVVLHDGGSGSAHVKTGGNIEATVADWKDGMPSVRELRLESNGGNVNVVVPPSLTFDYWISSPQPAWSPFKLEPASGDVQQGRAGPRGPSGVKLHLETVLIGEIAIRHP